jgi:hypothetical protein
LEALEFFLRSRMLDAGARALEALLEAAGAVTEAPLCTHNHLPRRMLSTGRRTKRLRTILGEVRWSRSRYVCRDCGAVRYPADEALRVVGTSFSPASRRMITRAGSREPFAEAADDLHLYARLCVDAKDVERIAESVGRQIAQWMDGQGAAAVLHNASQNGPCEPAPPPDTLYVSFDGTGAPMRAQELTHTKGKSPDGRARTREVKLGCVFTQTTVDDQGHPVRDPASTTYIGAITDSNTFGHQIYAEAVRRGLSQARQVAALTDGAAYNKSIIAEHFPHAIHIIDLYHSREHLADTLKLLGKNKPPDPFDAQCRAFLDNGEIENLIAHIHVQLPRSGPRRNALLKQLRYFKDNADLMRYAYFRSLGLFVGSGVVEAGCKTLIGKRLKGSGMFWTVRGANAIIASRCCQYSGRFEQFWEDHAA